MIRCGQIFLLLSLTLFLKQAELVDIDSLIRKANIYYEQPLLDGKPREFSLGMMKDLKSKSDIKIIIHGFLGNRFHNSIKPLRHAYMAQGVDNVFLADWEEAANLDYQSSRNAVANVGIHFGKILQDFLNKHEIPLTQVHVIGHSLGAHIAGNIGRYFNGSLGRVTGLDPALPLFSPKSQDSLHVDTAIFVDVIHTDFPVFGDITPRGTADFYPNYGHTPQRGCDDDGLLTASKLIFNAYSCSHNRAVILYAESVGLPKSYPTIPCSMNAIRMRTSSMCLQKVNELGLTKTTLAEAIKDENQDVVVYMGEFVSKNASGLFYLETYDVPPYGKGVYTELH